MAGGAIKHGGMCLDAKDKAQLRLAACDAGSATQKFSPDPAAKGRIQASHRGPYRHYVPISV